MDSYIQTYVFITRRHLDAFPHCSAKKDGWIVVDTRSEEVIGKPFANRKDAEERCLELNTIAQAAHNARETSPLMRHPLFGGDGDPYRFKRE
jgi:hypothetical protein